MRIEFNPNFINHFLDIWHYIADESTAAANNFEVQLREKINTLPHFPPFSL